MNKKQKSLCLYTILFCITALIIFSIFIKNNKGFIWNADGFQQHYAILYDLGQMIREGIKTFSWDMGLGLDVIRTILILYIRRPICIHKSNIPSELARNNI